jgi:hypothetical protein
VLTATFIRVIALTMMADSNTSALEGGSSLVPYPRVIIIAQLLLDVCSSLMVIYSHGKLV